MIAVAFSWKVSFVLIMIVGLVWAFIWFKFVKERPAPTEDAPAMKAAIQSHEQHIPMTFYLKQKRFSSRLLPFSPTITSYFSS